MDTVTPIKRDSKLVADEHDLAVLEALHRFGWLPTRDLSAYLWPTHTGTSCAKRSLARLRKAGYIAQNTFQKNRAPDGAVISVLTEAGASFLNAVMNLRAVSGEHLLQHFAATYRHRCLSNEFVIEWLNRNNDRGWAINTEYEISMRRSVLDRKDGSAGAKVADAFIIEDADASWSATRKRVAEQKGWRYVPQRWATWIEVENAYKKEPEQAKLGRELCALMGEGRAYPTSRDDVVIHSALVLCPDAYTERRLVNTVLEATFAPQADRFNWSDVLAGVSVWRERGTQKTVDEYVKGDSDLTARKDELLRARVTRANSKR